MSKLYTDVYKKYIKINKRKKELKVLPRKTRGKAKGHYSSYSRVEIEVQTQHDPQLVRRKIVCNNGGYTVIVNGHFL